MLSSNQKYQSGIVKYVDLLRERYFMYDELVAFIVEILSSRITSKAILSLGCGTCSIETRLAKSGFHVTGVDHDEQSLEIARQRIQEQNVKVDLVCHDIFEPLPVNPTSTVLLLFSALPIEMIKRAICNINDVLVKDAIFLFDVYERTSGEGEPPLIFLDDFLGMGEDAICVSSYMAHKTGVDGAEVYLSRKSNAGEIDLMVDYTTIPIVQTTALSELESQFSFGKSRFQVEGIWTTTEFCPTAAPPFCVQKIICIKKLS